MGFLDYSCGLSGVMASVQSPPGCPGFKIRPLKPLAEVPSGRRLMWLSQHDSKYKFKQRKISNIMRNMRI